MDLGERNGREVALPASALVGLRQALRKEAGPLTATHALHAAGYSAGAALYPLFEAELSGGARSLDEETFWGALRDFLARRGWGSFQHGRIHPGLGLVTSRDASEADPSLEESQPSCAFTCGLLASMLGSAAGGSLAVLEVNCRSRGDEECRFAIGSDAAIHEVYGRLLEGADLEAALQGL